MVSGGIIRHPAKGAGGGALCPCCKRFAGGRFRLLCALPAVAAIVFILTAVLFPSSERAVVYADPILTISPATLPAVDTGASYTQALTSSGGTAPYAYYIVSGTLPGGISLATN